MANEKRRGFALGDIWLGGPELNLIAGPCALESETDLEEVAASLQRLGQRLLRAGVCKPRTSPRSYQGQGLEGLAILSRVAHKYGLYCVSELTDLAHLEAYLEHVDIIQVGARSMQYFPLLRALGRVDKPVLLKRGFGNTVEELLGAADYILEGGNRRLILCERGIRSFETATRATLDLGAVALLKQRCSLPVFVDPSHAAGRADLVEPLALAALAAGADGLLLELHPDPKRALSDPQQQLDLPTFEGLVRRVRRLTDCLRDF